MEEADVRDLIDTVRYKKFTPNKFQQLWDTVQQEVWILADDETAPLTANIRGCGGRGLHGPHVGAQSGATAQTGYPFPRSFISGQARFHFGCWARSDDLQRTAPANLKETTHAIELEAWQTKTSSAVETKKKPVTLICPRCSFAGLHWWTPLIRRSWLSGTSRTLTPWSRPSVRTLRASSPALPLPWPKSVGPSLLREGHLAFLPRLGQT